MFRLRIGIVCLSFILAGGGSRLAAAAGTATFNSGKLLVNYTDSQANIKDAVLSQTPAEDCAQERFKNAERCMQDKGNREAGSRNARGSCP